VFTRNKRPTDNSFIAAINQQVHEMLETPCLDDMRLSNVPGLEWQIKQVASRELAVRDNIKNGIFKQLPIKPFK
jgi:hypothetical protein